MKQSRLQLFRSFLTWFLTFYLLFWGIQLFFNDQEEAGVTERPSIEVITDQKVIEGTPLLVTLRNNTDQDWIYKDICKDGQRPLIARVFNQTQTVNLEYSEADCQQAFGVADFSVPAGGTYEFGIGALNARFFTEAGNYRVSLPGIEGANAEFAVKEAGGIRKLFRAVITQPLFNLLVFLVDHIPSHSLGWAIVTMTLLVRLVLLLPNQKAMKSQRKLQKLQPEIQALKKKHGKNQQAMAMGTMELYKRHKINPMSSCLPIFLQMPFLLGIYFVVRDGISPQFQGLLYKFQNTLDLSVVNNAFFGLDLSIPNIWVLPVIVGVAQFFAMRLAIPPTKKDTPTKKSTKKSKPAEPDMAEQMQQMQKMMIWIFPFMIAFFTATFPAGVGIYWLTSTVFGIAQQKFVNWQIDQPKVRKKA